MDETFRVLWKRYRTWAKTSRHLKTASEKWKRRVLILTLAGTSLATLAPFAAGLGGGAWLSRAAALGGTVALAFATYFGKELLDTRHEERWTRARMAAEALKSEAHRYAAQAPPYDTTEREALLRARLAQLNELTANDIPDQIGEEESTRGMPAAFWSPQDYKKNRLDEQVKWYRDGAARHTASMAKGRSTSLTLGCAAVSLGAITGAAPTDGTLPAAILGVITTAGAAIGAYFQASHYEAIALKYRATADALEEKGLAFSARLTQNLQLIAEAEAIMQAENTAWLTEMTSTKSVS